MEWAAFEQVEGPVVLHERLDHATALIAFIQAKAAGAKSARFKDFLPAWDTVAAEADNAADMEAIFKEASSQPSPPSS